MEKGGVVKMDSTYNRGIGLRWKMSYKPKFWWPFYCFDLMTIKFLIQIELVKKHFNYRIVFVTTVPYLQIVFRESELQVLSTWFIVRWSDNPTFNGSSSCRAPCSPHGHGLTIPARLLWGWPGNWVVLHLLTSILTIQTFWIV